jgi:hypothetical protein
VDPLRLHALKEQIEQAFADVPYPGDDHIIDDPHDWECIDLLACFKGKHWKELSHEDLFQNSLSFVGIDAFAFYLPAYLFASLASYKHLISHVVYGLCLLDDSELIEWQVRRFDRLSRIQKQAVRSFLEYMRDENAQYFGEAEEIQDALTRYWTHEA